MCVLLAFVLEGGSPPLGEEGRVTGGGGEGRRKGDRWWWGGKKEG